jgi:hypothetical protein
MRLTLLTIVVVLGATLLWLARVQSKRARAWSRQRVEAALANALDLDGAGNHDEFDLFVGGALADPQFETLRAEILAICQSEGRPPGRDFGPRAHEWLRQTYAALKQTP